MKWERREYEINIAGEYETVTGHVYGCIAVRQEADCCGINRKRRWRADHVPTGLHLSLIRAKTLKELKPLVEKIAVLPDWRLITRKRQPRATIKRLGRRVREIMGIPQL